VDLVERDLEMGKDYSVLLTRAYNAIERAERAEGSGNKGEDEVREIKVRQKEFDELWYARLRDSFAEWTSS